VGFPVISLRVLSPLMDWKGEQLKLLQYLEIQEANVNFIQSIPQIEQHTSPLQRSTGYDV
jgi:hypothetical protein